MQNVGQQYGQGGTPSHQGTTYGLTESSQTNSGSVTSSLRLFRKKDVDKQQVSDASTAVAETHVARVAPHNHYPPRPQDCYRYPSQFSDYSLQSQVKYSEISDHQPLQDQISPSSVIQKAKGKEYMEMCNVPQPHMKQSYSDHLGNQQPYAADPNLHPHAQYLHKDPQTHPSYKPESQYYPKEAQYQQLPHQMQKYNVPSQIRKYTAENDFLTKLRRIHPTMARSIMSDHHLQESQSSYQAMDQNRIYPHQNQRYMNFSSTMQNNPYPHGYMPPQHYSNYPASCSYTRSPQMPPRFPSTNPHERSISPRRGYGDNLTMPPINYTPIPQRISPNYSQYNPPEYAQHYQHRRGPVAPQEFYQQPCRTAPYLPHQMAQQDITENRVTVSDSIKQYIENWADEETASEMNQIETNRLCKENMRVRDDQSTETVYMINASELQYLENGIPLVTSENGIPLVTSENGQYFLKSGVTIDNSAAMVRIIDKNNQTTEPTESTSDRIVNLHIMDPQKSDCMLTAKPNEKNQRANENYNTNDKPRVVIHQNTIIQPSQVSGHKEPETDAENQNYQGNVGISLPVLMENGITANENVLEKLADQVLKECKKETVDKNCSPINMDHLEKLEDINDTSIMCPLKLLEHAEDTPNSEEMETDDSKLKNMPIIDLLSEGLQGTIEESQIEDEKSIVFPQNEHDNAMEEVKNEFTIQECKSTDAAKNGTAENWVEVTNECEKFQDKNTTRSTEQVQEEIKEEHNKELPENNRHLSEFPKEDIKEESKDQEIIATTEEVQSVIVSRLTSMQEHENLDVSNCVGDNPVTSLSAPISPEDNGDRNAIRRTRRIFSVDDIINNIGNNSNKLKTENQAKELRQNIEKCKEFLQKEIETSIIFIKKSTKTEGMEPVDSCLEKTEIKATFKDVVDIRDGLNEPAEEEKKETALNKKQENVSKGENEKVTSNEKQEQKIILEDENEEAEIAPIKKENTSKNEETAAKDEEIHTIDEDRQKTVQEIEDNSVSKEMDTSIIDNNLAAEEREEKKMKEAQIIETEEAVIDEKEASPKCVRDEAAKFNSKEETKEQVNIVETLRASDEMQTESIDPEISNDQTEEVDDNEVVSKELPSSFETYTVESNTKYIVEEPEEIAVIETETCDNFSQDSQSDLNVKDISLDVSQSDVQYRNAIRVDENNVLLEIAGELVEITVNMINGKKVITVVPLSESTVVDMNDNYETLDTTQIHEQLKPTGIDTEQDLEVSQLVSVDCNGTADPDVIETTSEIIIGMDISLEEEIQLDLEKPQTLCTKAAKKLYENDLQIPSITTSEDVTDNNKAESYSPNDKVSSSKEQKREKRKSEKRKSVRSLNGSDSGKKIKRSDTDKEPTKKVKEEASAGNKEETEEFVPFKDLIKARKLKKMKQQQQMRLTENVTADSTNKMDQYECSETVAERCEKRRNDEVETGESDDTSTLEEKTGDVRDQPKEISEIAAKILLKSEEIDNNGPSELNEEEKNANGGCEKEEDSNIRDSDNKETIKNFTEKPVKRVTFGTVNYKEAEAEPPFSSIEDCKPEDPRLSKNNKILVPSVSELIKENEGLTNNKKKLSLAEYNSRKRKHATKVDQHEKEEPKKRIISPEINFGAKTAECDIPKLKYEIKKLNDEPRSRLRIHRPKSLDDIELFGKVTDNSFVKRKFSLEMSSKPNHFDWEETQSPKININSQDPQKRLSEFRGLINDNKMKVVVGVSEMKAGALEYSPNDVLQTYKEQIDSKLSSLNLKIPRPIPKPPSIDNLCTRSETTVLMQRFLKSEKLTSEEMEKIKKIISYKRLMQQLDKMKSPMLKTASLNPSYEIRKSCSEKDMKLHLKKVPDKKKKRFRNLYTEASDESSSEFGNGKRIDGDYAVIQSNSFAAAGVPKLIIKRKTEMPVPVVRLERLDLNVLSSGKGTIC